MRPGASSGSNTWADSGNAPFARAAAGTSQANTCQPGNFRSTVPSKHLTVERLPVAGREHKQWAVPKLLALAAALWGALGPTAAMLHLGAAPHAICPEHGELIELGPGSARAAPGDAHRGWSSAAPAEGEAGGLDPHLHCAASTPLRSPALSAPRASFSV